MEKLTQEFLDELLATQEKLENMYEKLEMRICDVNGWEEDNIARKLCREDSIRGEITNVKIYNNKVTIKSFGFDYSDERDKEYWFSFPLNKLISDDWKEHALKEYQKKLEKKQEEQRIKEEILAQETEAKERAEYERLRAKYGN